ncbi:MAG: MFS transporter, partial [Actinocatenispora sp.]
AGSVLLGAVGAVRALRHPRPAVDLTLLRARPTAVGNAALVMVSIVQYSVVLCLTLLLSEVWHYPPSMVGLALTPGPIVTAVVSWAGGRWVQRFGPRPVVAVGTVVAIAASVWFGLVVGPEPAYLSTLLPMLVFGFGGVWLAGMGLNTLAVSAVPPRRFGTAGALTMLSRTLGATIGIASLAVVLAVPTIAGFRLSWLAVACCLVVVLGLMGLVRPEPHEAALPAAGSTT